MKMKWVAFAVLLLGNVSACVGEQQDAAHKAPDRDTPARVYSRDLLLNLQGNGVPEPGLLEDIPEELIRRYRRPRKQGKRGGVRHRLRRRHDRPLLHSILFSNTRALRNKMDKLRANIEFLHEYRESCVMVYTETWFLEDHPDQLTEVPGFSIVRMNCNADLTEKTRGGGICFYINKSWCSNYCVKASLCTPDLELLCLSFRPFYLPREFENIFICAVYIPSKQSAAGAAPLIADCVHQQLQNKPDASMFVLGNFNHCTLENVSSGFYQYVKDGTRKYNILDKCYGTILLQYNTLLLQKSDPRCQTRTITQ